MRKRKIKYVSEYRDRHGKWRASFRKTGFPSYSFKNKIGSEDFWSEYDACMKRLSPAAQKKTFTPPDHTMQSLAQVYFNGPKFKALAPSTKQTYRRMINRFLDQYGKAKVTAFTPRAIWDIMQQWGHAPTEANNLKKRLRTLFHLAIFMGWRETDPIIGVPNMPHKRIGFHTWNDNEIAAFEKHYPPGTKARLAFTIMLYTGLRRSDVVRLGRQHMTNNRIIIRAIKNGNLVDIPVHPVLKSELDRLPDDQMQFVLTDYGKPYSPAGFGNRMQKWTKDAAVPGCSSHGLRKAIACRLYEAGASLEEIGAVLGDKNLDVIRVYVEEANIARLTGAGFEKLQTKKSRKK